MNIYFVGAYDTPDFGGINSYMLNLSKELEIKGYHCCILRQSTRDYEVEIEGITFLNFKTVSGIIGGFDLFNKATDYILGLDNKPDVVCYQDFLYASLVGKRLGKKGVKVCYILHSFACDNPKNPKLMRLFEIFFTRLSVLMTNNLITVGDSMAALVKQRLKKTPYVVRGGIFLPNSKAVDSNILDKLGVSKDGYFLTIARIDPVKKHDVLIDGFKKYCGQKKLVIAGNIDNTYGEYLKKLGEDDDRIIFAGSVGGENKNTLLRNCLGYCLVSSSEGFPISLLEAMSFGKRCITSLIPPIVEAMSTELGYWCHVDSSEEVTAALVRVEYDENRVTREKQIFQRVKDNFTWSSSVEAFLSCIAKMK